MRRRRGAIAMASGLALCITGVGGGWWSARAGAAAPSFGSYLLSATAPGFEMSEDELRSITQPTLIVSAKDSPEAFRRVSSRMAELLPNCETVRVEGGHLVNPAHPEVLEFIDRVIVA